MWGKIMLSEIEKYKNLGYKYQLYEFEGYEGVIIFPVVSRKGNPWIWRTEFLGAFDYADRKLLGLGWNLVYIRMSDQYGAPATVQFMERFFKWVTEKFKLYEKVNLFGFSRGGLYAVNFAVRNAAKIQSIYLDAPVIDLASWPGGFYGTAPHLEKEWKEACQAYKCSEGELKKYRNGIKEKFQVLYENKIPIILVAGLADTVVPYAENGELLEKFMHENKSEKFRCIKKHECDHHPHSLKNPQEIVEFIEKCI